MPHFNMLLATIVLFALLLSEQQQLLVKAYSGGVAVGGGSSSSNSHSDVEKSQQHAKQQQQLYKQHQQQQQQQQRFSHHGRHHHHQHNNHHEHHQHQAISESVSTKYTPTNTRQQYHHQQLQQQQQLYKQQYFGWNHTAQHFGNVLQKFRNRAKDSEAVTYEPTTVIRESQEQQQHYPQQQHNHHYQRMHQKQQHQQQRQQIENSQHHQQQKQQHQLHQHHQHHSPTVNPSVTLHAPTSSSSSASLSSATYAHNHSKAVPLKHSSSYEIVATSFNGDGPKSRAAESPAPPHHIKSRAQNRLEDFAVRKHQSKSRKKPSVDLDYANDYYYDDEENDEDDGEYDDDNDKDLDEAGEDAAEEEEEYVANANGFSERDDHEYNRVARDHRYTNRLDEYAGKSDDQDYADDEPYRSSSAEQFQSDAAAVGVLTDQKFRELGTMEAVQQSRDKYLQEQELLRQKSPVELAREHMNRMKVATRCSRPMPRVIHVSNETSKRYIPYCTILHRCGHDTGCCDSTRQVCAAKSYEDVQVYFFVIKINSGTNRRETEVKTMRNHTECHCVDIAANNRQRDKRSGYTLRPLHGSSATDDGDGDGDAENQLTQQEDDADAANDICRCPRHFDALPDDAESAAAVAAMHPRNCRCDCLSSNTPCQRLKNGEEGFAVDDRKCIVERNCKAPVCAYGEYSSHTGRCPRLRNHKRTITHHNYGFG